ncbi:hypothetical protein Q9L58_010851, partial [Maublancomyces gigas]
MHQRLSASRIKKSIALARADGREVWLSDDHGAYGNGRLVLRITPGGVQRFYYRPPRATGRSTAIPIGLYSRISQTGYLTLTQARHYASSLYLSLNSEAVRELKVIQPQASPLKAEPCDVLESTSQTKSHTALTLVQLCRDYVKWLRDTKKKSASEINTLVERLIATNELANIAARQITSEAITDLLRKVIDLTSGHTGQKVRSLLHAAYGRTLKAKFDPSSPKSQVDHGIESNPITGVDSLAQFKKARDRYLRDSELAEVWRQLQSDTELSIPIRGVRLCLLLGGQRAEQVVSVKINNVDLEARTLLILDGKGRRALASYLKYGYIPMEDSVTE